MKISRELYCEIAKEPGSKHIFEILRTLGVELPGRVTRAGLMGLHPAVDRWCHVHWQAPEDPFARDRAVAELRKAVGEIERMAELRGIISGAESAERVGAVTFVGMAKEALAKLEADDG